MTHAREMMKGHVASYQPGPLWQELPGLRVHEATAYFEPGNAKPVLLYIASDTEVLRLKTAIERHQQLTDKLVEREWFGILPEIIDIIDTSDALAMVVEPPTGMLLPDDVVQNGSLTESRVLLLALKMMVLLQVVHEEMEMALTPSLLENIYFDTASGQLWWPLWLGWVEDTTAERRMDDLWRAGVIWYGALLGIPPLNLWGRLLPASSTHPRWADVSIGMQRLLRHILRPSVERRYQHDSELIADVRWLYDAWQEDDVEVAVARARALVEKGEWDGVMQAQALLDILRRRKLDWGQVGDYVWSDIKSLLDENRVVTGATNLLRGGSIDAAMSAIDDAIRQNPHGLELLRWRAILAEDRVWQIMDDEMAYETLQATVNALSNENIELAHQLIDQTPLATLQSEIATRLAWQQAIDVAHDVNAALEAVEKAQEHLQKLHDAAFRNALDEELGGLASWRIHLLQIKTKEFQKDREEAQVSVLHDLINQGLWSEAVNMLQRMFTQRSLEPLFVREGEKIGYECLRKKIPAIAERAFALLAMNDNEHRTTHQMAWDVARTISQLQRDPFSIMTVRSVQRVVAALTVIGNATFDDNWHSLASSFEYALVDAVTRVRSTESEAVKEMLGEMEQAWRQLYVAINTSELEDHQVFVEMERWVQRGLIIDEVITHLILNKWEGKQFVGRERAGNHETEPFTEVITTLTLGLKRVLNDISPGLDDGDDVEELTVAMLKHLLMSSDLSEIDRAIRTWNKFYRLEQLDINNRKDILLLLKEGVLTLEAHKNLMVDCVNAEKAGDYEQAMRLLNDATLNEQSLRIWDPESKSWEIAGLWRLRLESRNIERLREMLEGPNLQLWAQIIHLSEEHHPDWSDDIYHLVKKRKHDVNAHEHKMKKIFVLSERDPDKAFKEFQKWLYKTSTPVCWHPRREKWAPLKDIQIELAHNAGIPPGMLS